jgi:hypothetical protein
MAETTINASDGVLETYLAGRDASCPSCGYNLRGATGSTCPECGQGIRLGLLASNPLWRRQGLMILVLLWLLLAGGMNSYRTGHEVYSSATVSSQWIRLSALKQQYRNLAAPAAPAPLASRTVLIPSLSPQTEDERVVYNVVTPGLFTTSTPTPTIAWTNVPWGQWTRLGAWSALSVVAVTGLVLLVRHRRRPREGTARAITVIAWSGFAVYFAVHVSLFALEVLP